MASRFRVAVTDFLHETSVEEPILGPIADLAILNAANGDEMAAKAADADALLVFHEIFASDAALGQLPKCRLLVRVGVGYDNVDLESAGRRGIVVCNVPDYGTEEVADHAIMLLLAIARRLIPCHNGVVAGGWTPDWMAGTPRLRGKTLGLIGCGRIGTATALRGKALGMRVVIFDPYQPHGLDKALGVERVFRLDDLLKQSEFLSVHTPLTAETRHIVNAAALAKLPRGAYVINTARGPCVDNEALLAALDSGHVAAAGLDVVEREPLDNERLRNHPRVTLTPHTAFYSEEGWREMRRKGAEEVRRALHGEPVWNPVNLHCLQNPRCRVGKEPT